MSESDSELINSIKHPFIFATVNRNAAEDEMSRLKDSAFNCFIHRVENYFKDRDNCVDKEYKRTTACNWCNWLLASDNVSKAFEVVSNIVVKDNSFNKECVKEVISSGFSASIYTKQHNSLTFIPIKEVTNLRFYQYAIKLIFNISRKIEIHN